MFDFIEEDLTDAKEEQGSKAQFKEEENPIYTMPTTYRRERKTGGSDKKLLFIILGSFFLLAVIGTGIFLFLSQQKAPPVVQQTPPPTEQKTEQVAETEEAQTPTREETPPTEAESQPTGQQEATPAVPVETSTQVVPQQTAVPLLGIDADQDGLTDIEERLFSTDPQKNDTDSDSYIDGDELKNLYDPLRSEQARLDVSGLVNTYTNQTFQYSLLYPSSWVAQSTDRTDREVMISSATGEFFTIAVEDNPNHLSPVDWYVKQASPGSDTARVQSFTYETWAGVMTADSQAVYLTRNETDPQKLTGMYVLKYNLNTKNELNFITTMQMMLKSFVFTDLSFVK